jgi:ornithine cyclodeaminase
MYYLNEKNLLEVGIHWPGITRVVRQAVGMLEENDFAQPIKPYLRYNDPVNRIIAMPAYVGGNIDMAGIKWIASFPGNLRKGLSRAHAVVILNEGATGVPQCLINSTLISGIRTAGVSGVMIEEYLKRRGKREGVSVGIIGLGPIGRLHAEMISSLLGPSLDTLYLYDLEPSRAVPWQGVDQEKVTWCDSWEEAYRHADIVVTCTVSAQRYINQPPKPGALLLNVSLRDYAPEMRRRVDWMIVDDWDEVCRENTDIECMHRTEGLLKSQTHSIVDVVCHDRLAAYTPDQVIMFNPMGMAVFDIAVGNYYYQLARTRGIGLDLEALTAREANHGKSRDRLAAPAAV